MDSKETKENHKSYFIVINLARLILVAAIVGSYLNGRWLVFFTAIVALVVTFVPWMLKKFFDLKIPAWFEITVLLLIYGSLFFGEVRGFYARFWWWNILLNTAEAIILGLIGLTILVVLYKDEKIEGSPIMISIFAFCFSLAIGTLWEILEFILDNFFSFNLQQASLRDSMFDLVFNAIGAAVVVIAGYFYLQGGQKTLVSKLITTFMENNPILFKGKKDSLINNIREMTKRGESEKVEFKSTLRTNLYTGQIDSKIEYATIRTIAAYLNSNGGMLILGVDDKGEIAGLEKDNFQSTDKMLIHFTNLLKAKIGNEYSSLVKLDIIEIDGKTVLRVECERSDKPVFVKSEGEEEFFIRNGPASMKLSGSSLVNYIQRRFTKSY